MKVCFITWKRLIPPICSDRAAGLCLEYSLTFQQYLSKKSWKTTVILFMSFYSGPKFIFMFSEYHHYNFGQKIFV
uniref:Uncharacterized protein n=1 Tax=Anguilla anguilla TaxID=7936 RepID=A0A0E9WNM1_ANGAN